MSNEKEINAINSIQKKLLGKRLNYREIYNLMDEISHHRLSDIMMTYFVASSFKEGYSSEELYFFTKAMVETGSRLHFKGIVADKHSTGGVAGTKTTMIIVPIIAAAGIKIPKISSRAITSPSGTADTMEVLAKVNLKPKEVTKIVEKVGGCIAWNEYLKIAPADDVNIKVVFDVSETLEPAGRGVGPALEARDVLYVLEQKAERPLMLEAKALRLAGKLLDLCFADLGIKKSGEDEARLILTEGRALKKFREIIKAQQGDDQVSSENFKLKSQILEVNSPRTGKIRDFNLK